MVYIIVMAWMYHRGKYLHDYGGYILHFNMPIWIHWKYIYCLGLHEVSEVWHSRLACIIRLHR
jgi:hypothetical protein